MTQSPPRPTLPLSLVSLRLPETVDWSRNTAQSATESALNVLHLTPDLVSEIAIELENSGLHPIDWTLEITGNFPPGWYYPAEEARGDTTSETMDSISPGNVEQQAQAAAIALANQQQLTGTIEPREHLYSSVSLKVPHDFFEAQAALLQHSSLQLNYDAEIFLFAHWGGQQRLAGYQSLRIEVRPNSDYKTLLPEIFQSQDFMVRFLSIFEQTFDPSLQTLSMLTAHLDPLTAPRSMLPFLSKWVAWEMNPQWNLKQQRRLIRYAIELYRWRGTRRGLRYYLHLYTGMPLDENIPESQKHISILDETKKAFVFGQAQLGETDPSTVDSPFVVGGGKPFHFEVILRPDPHNQIDESLVRQVIEQVKPAFCTYQLVIEPHQEPTSEINSSQPQVQFI